MKANIYISGRINKDETLKDVIRQFKSFDDVTEVEVDIKSNGGNVSEGEAIYNYLKNLDAEIPVTTKTGKAYSIAAKIFAAGSKRIVENVDKAVMIHFAMAEIKGTAEELEYVAAELREIEQGFITFYSEHLDIDEDTVKNLLDNETFVSGLEAVELGFATEVETEAEITAELSIDKLNNNKNTMSKTTKKSFIQKMMDEFKAYLEGDKEVEAELTLQDSSGTEILFTDVESGETPKVGDKATVDGTNVSDGSYIMPSLEDVTFVFKGGEIVEIKEKEEDQEEEVAITAEEIKEVVTWSVQTANTTFEVGETLMLEPWMDEGENYAASAGEWKLKDGRSIVTDASGVIVTIKTEDTEEDPVVEEVTEVEASYDELLEKAVEKVVSKVTAKFNEVLDEKDEEIKGLKAKIGGKEFEAQAKEDKGKLKEKGVNKAAIIWNAEFK